MVSEFFKCLKRLPTHLNKPISSGKCKRRLAYNVSGLKVPKREIFDRSDFPDFYTIKSSWVGDLLVKILTYYFNF